jgi:arylsulfatase A-like enzyme
MLDNTLVMFFSDNGGLIQPGSPETYTFIQKIGATAVEWLGRPVPSFPLPGLEFLAANTFDGGSDNTPLPGGKTMASEGGVRVPAAIWWPGELDGGTHDQPFTVTDVLPTLLDAIGAKTDIPKALDGRSQLAALRGQVSEHADYAVSDLASGLAMYRWPWKLVGGVEPKLYHLIDDPLEQTDLSISEPEQLAQMQKKMASWGFQEDPGIPIVEALLDPDTFGGEEDGRLPWAETTVD